MAAIDGHRRYCKTNLPIDSKQYEQEAQSIKRRIKDASHLSSRMIHALVWWAAKLRLPNNTFRLMLVCYGLRHNERKVKSSLLGLLRYFDPDRMPPENATEADKEKAWKYMSNVIQQAKKDFAKRGYFYLLNHTPGKEGNVTEFDWPIFAIVSQIVRQAVIKHEGIKNYKGIRATTIEKAERFFSKLNKLEPPQCDDNNPHIGSPLKDRNAVAIKRLQKHIQGMIANGDSTGLCDLEFLLERELREIQEINNALRVAKANDLDSHDAIQSEPEHDHEEIKKHSPIIRDEINYAFPHEFHEGNWPEDSENKEEDNSFIPDKNILSDTLPLTGIIQRLIFFL